MTTFRCHYVGGTTLDVTAANPDEARKAAQVISKGIITKVKRLRAAA